MYVNLAMGVCPSCVDEQILGSHSDMEAKIEDVTDQKIDDINCSVSVWLSVHPSIRLSQDKTV